MINSILGTVLLVCGLFVCGCTDGTSNAKTAAASVTEEKPTEKEASKGCGGSCCSSKKEATL